MEDTVDDAMLEEDDEVRVENVLEVMPGLMSDKAEDDDEDELLGEIPDAFGLVKLLEEETEEGDKTRELLDGDGTEVVDTLELPELLYELRTLVPEPSKLLVGNELSEVRELL